MERKKLTYRVTENIGKGNGHKLSQTVSMKTQVSGETSQK